MNEFDVDKTQVFFIDDLKDFLDEKYEPIEAKGEFFLYQSAVDCDEEINEVLNRLEKSFQERLFELIRQKKLSEVEIYTKADLTRQHFSKIRSNVDYQPTKMTVVYLAFAMQLSYAETTELLKKAGFALSHSSKTDLIIEYFICHHNYDIFTLRESIEKYH